MTQEIHEQVQQALRHFRLPTYDEITNVGLYLDQTTRYINEYMFPLSEDMAITSSMISNYVKQHLIPSPIHKQYSRDQIACLIAITMAKTILSMDHIYALIHMRDITDSFRLNYEFFREELNRSLQYVFGIASDDTANAPDNQKDILIRNMTIAIAHKIYLDVCFTALTRSGLVELPGKKEKAPKKQEKPKIQADNADHVDSEGA